MASYVAERDAKLKQFISSHFQQSAESLESMLGDAGLRSYYRLISGGKSYIVMDCPPTYCDVQQFIDIASYLKNKGFSTPEIIGQDSDQGFLILEDFGTLSVKDYLLSGLDQSELKRKQIYHLIIDLLVSLQEQEVPSTLVEFDNELLILELGVFVDWYIPYAYNRKLGVHEFEEFIDIWQHILAEQVSMPNSIVLRDYHVENMMYLEQRESIRQLGLLDFQDAIFGSPVYDLVSVLEDARLEISRDEALQYAEYFAQKKKIGIESLLRNYHILGAQRNSRILGVFVRKANRDGDDSYLKYIPRVLKYLEYDLSYFMLEPLRHWLEKLKLSL